MTGLLFFIVVAMWGSVLIPIALNNQDRRNLEKSLLTADQKLPRWHWQQRESLSTRQRAFIRRRRVAMTLLASLFASVVMSAAGKISFGWIIVPVGLLGGFVYIAKKNHVDFVKPVQRATSSTAHDIHQTQAIPLSKVVVEKIVEEKVQVQKRTWVPVETPLPSYVQADKAASIARRNERYATWTNQDMVDAAVQLRQQRAQKLAEAQARLEEARALAMENARRAAMAANENNGVAVSPFRRAANQ